MQVGFDNDLYIQKQRGQIIKRIEKFGNKLYLEFGGKLFDDYHAARVLPGFDVNGKIRLLQALKNEAEIVFCICARDIEKNKIRADMGITYDMDVLRLIDQVQDMNLSVNSVVITQYTGQAAADGFKKRLEMRDITVYIHKPIYGYPSDIERVVSDEGYGMNPYIKTTKPLVVVTAPGPGSGKLATCLSQMYHENKRGVQAGYAKFETFPIWNLPLKHPVNLAYEAATADLQDINVIDPFHLEAYGKTTVNYNRDVDVFLVVKTMLEKICGFTELYQSPTDMGVNMAGYAIFDDEVVKEAARQEIIRRYYKACCDYKQGRVDIETVQKIDLIMKQIDIKPQSRRVVEPALAKMKETGAPAVAIELPDGAIVTGKTGDMLNASSGCLLNAIKKLAGISDGIHLISPVVLGPMFRLKKEILGGKNTILNVEETLIALSICAATNPTAEHAMSKLTELKNCEAHATTMLIGADEAMFRKLGINLTCEPEFPSKALYYI